jgi:hypothetical protein
MQVRCGGLPGITQQYGGELGQLFSGLTSLVARASANVNIRTVRAVDMPATSTGQYIHLLIVVATGKLSRSRYALTIAIGKTYSGCGSSFPRRH